MSEKKTAPAMPAPFSCAGVDDAGDALDNLGCEQLAENPSGAVAPRVPIKQAPA